LWLTALLLRVKEVFGCYVSLHSARSACTGRLTAQGRTNLSETEACVDLKGPARTRCQLVMVFNLGRGGVPRGRPVAGQLSDTPLCAGLTHFTLCVPVFEFQGSITFPLSSSPAGTSSWNRAPTAARPNAGDRPCSRAALMQPLLKGESLASTSVCV
jgi:hypothetical protein